MPKTADRLTLSRIARAAHGGILPVERAAEELELPRRKTAILLASLVRRGWLVRVRRGLYLVPALEASPDRSPVVEDPWVLANALYAPCYVGGWSAAEHWGLTEQIFRSIFVISAGNIRRSMEQVLGVEFRVVRVRRSRLRHAVPIWRGTERVLVSTRAGTVADALASPDWVGGIRPLADMLVAFRESGKWDPSALLAALKSGGRGAGYKRLGFLIETLLPAEVSLSVACERKRTTGYVRLDPAVPERGRLNRRWGLWVNVPAETLRRPE